MTDIDSINKLGLLLVFIVPGLVAAYSRSQFLTGRQPRQAEAAVNYLVLTVVYYGITFPFARYVFTLDIQSWWQSTMWIVLILIGPVAFGTLLGIMAATAQVKKLLSKFGLISVHPMPTAWDYIFGKGTEHYVLVVLKDKTKFAGVYSGNSFSSSEPTERDIYVERLFNIGKGNRWSIAADKSVWINSSEIQSIEFWPYRTKEISDG